MSNNQNDDAMSDLEYVLWHNARPHIEFKEITLSSIPNEGVSILVRDNGFDVRFSGATLRSVTDRIDSFYRACGDARKQGSS